MLSKLLSPVSLTMLLALTATANPALELVTLTMTERTGVSRQAEWITIGVPLPKGKIRSTEELCVLQNGHAVAAEILPVNRWWDDGSLRWIHLIFQSHCPANGIASIVLAMGSETPPPKQTVKVTERNDRFLVDTGAIAFEVRKRGFNIIDVAKIGDEKFDYDCRLYAYAGSAEVRLVVSLVNRQGRDVDFIPLSSFLLELPTTITTGKCSFGAEDGGIQTGNLSDESEAYIYQVSSSEHIFGGAVKGKVSGKQIKPSNIGWAYLSDAKKDMGVGIRWFWQLHPKSIELTADGMVRADLYPEQHDKPLKIYTGVARTHEVRLCFDSGSADAGKLKSTFAGLQQPLRPFAPPKWYCRDTQALGDYCETGGTELYGPFAERVVKFEEAFELANRRCQAFRDSRTIKGVETDSYGFLGFGDGVHHVWTLGIDVPENIAWDGNYYGYPHMMCIQFLRTGNPEYFDNFEAHAFHVADIHTVHYSEKRHLIGGCRYCPPTDHVRIDPTDWNDYRTAKVYVSNLFNHHKVAGVIERWYFLRDHRSLDVANMVLDYCYRWTYGDNDFCYQGYMLTGDRKWIERASNVLRVHKGRDLKLSFQAGIFLEGMRRYYEMSGDAEALAYIKASVDRLIDTGKKGGVTAQAHSFMYLKTGEKKYLDAALDNLPQSGQFGNPWKQFALSMRNAAMCIGDLHRVAKTD
jgi:hypothetical protein